MRLASPAPGVSAAAGRLLLRPDRKTTRLTLAHARRGRRHLCRTGPRAARGRGALAVLARCCWLLLARLLPHGAAPPRRRADDLRADPRRGRRAASSYAVDFELSRSVEDALSKACRCSSSPRPQLYRNRWYWRDRASPTRSRVWRIVYQPLTATYRVDLRRPEPELRHAAPKRWPRSAAARAGRSPSPAQIDDGSRHYVEFSYRLDTTQLPRPMQIGVGGQPDWQLSVKRTQRIMIAMRLATGASSLSAPCPTIA